MDGRLEWRTTWQPKRRRPRRERLPLNGVDTPTLFGTLDVVKGQPELAKFQFRARNRWQSGTLSETTIGTFSGAGGEHAHKTTFKLTGDHPAVLVGEDRAPLPVEFLLHALASCITGGIANIAAARGVTLTEVESTIEGDINLLGILGMSKRRPQRLSGHPRQLFDQRRRATREAAGDRRAVARAFRGVRRADQRRARVDVRQRRLSGCASEPSERAARTAWGSRGPHE